MLLRNHPGQIDERVPGFANLYRTERASVDMCGEDGRLRLRQRTQRIGRKHLFNLGAVHHQPSNHLRACGPKFSRRALSANLVLVFTVPNG